VVRELAAADGVPVATACRVLEVSTSGYYDWDSRPASDRAWEQAQLMDAIRDAHASSYGTYGTYGCTPNWSSVGTYRSAMAGSSA
jgi:hypothetical protein